MLTSILDCLNEYSCTKGGIHLKQSDMRGLKRFLRPITYGILSGIAACLLLLILMSIIMVIQDVPDSVVTLMATLTFVFGGIVAGFVSSGYSREKGLFLGIICGTCLFAILSIASLAIYGSDFGMQALTKFVAVLLAASFGGVVGVNRRKKLR